MTLLNLGPGSSPGYIVPQGNGVIDLTAVPLATVGANTGVTFPNMQGVTMLLLKTVTGSPTVTITIGTTLLGQSVTPVPVTTATAGDLYLIGPFYSIDELVGGNTIQVNWTTAANVAGVAVLQPAAVP